MKKIYLFGSIFLILGCNDKTIICNGSELSNKLIIENWRKAKIEKNKIHLEEYDITFSQKTKTINIESNTIYEDKNLTDYNNMIVILKEPLCSGSNYKLTLSDSLKYEISNIRTVPKTVMVGLNKKTYYLVDSYEMNGEVIKNLYESPDICIKY